MLRTAVCFHILSTSLSSISISSVCYYSSYLSRWVLLWLVGWLGLLSQYNREFCPALAAQVGPVQNIFFFAVHYFNLSIPIAQQAGQAVVQVACFLVLAGSLKVFLEGSGHRCTKSLRVLFLHRRPPSLTTLVLYSRAVFIFNEPALCVSG
jgi:hypothetical protein